MTKKLSRLQPIELRKVWGDEAKNFTPWLAQAENLELLGETLGLELELVGTEKAVGDFRADILCKNVEDNTYVLIENQLEQTDHNHLGQILTYAAGLDASMAIWIAREFREEHRAALDRLNEITNERLQCFGIEVKVWQIGNSPPAPQFEIVSKPNDWKRSASQRGSDDWKTQFWAELNEHFREVNLEYNITPRPNSAVWFSIGGSSRYGLGVGLSQQRKHLRIQLWISENAEAYFHLLKEEKEAIETEFGERLKWTGPSKAGKSWLVDLYKTDTDPQDEADWGNLHRWIATNLPKFDKVFRKRLKDLDPADYVPDELEDDSD